MKTTTYVHATSRSTRIETWIDDALITLDTNDVWSDTFAHWDCLVDTDMAARIATATVDALLAAEAL